MKCTFTLFILALCLGASLDVQAQDLDSGLVIYYNFEGDLTDSISGETAENNGNLTFQEGKVGDQAVQFFNQDAYFVTPRGKLQIGPEADGGTAGTFALWVNHRAGPLETDRQNYLAQKNGCGPEDNNRGRVVLYRQDPTNDSDPDSLISFITGRPLRTGYKLDTADTWIHLALTIDPEEREWAFFLNGIEFSRDTFTGTTQAENSCGEFVVGHHLTFTNENQTFDGLMDDLRFYNRELTAQEIGLLAGVEVVGTREVLATSALSISPNPTSPDLAVTIGLDREVFSPGSNVELRVMDISGRQVLSRTYANAQDRLQLEHNLRSGVYTVSITDGQRLAAAKLIVR